LKNNIIEDAKPGDVEAVVQEQLDAANSKVVIEELVSWKWTISNRISIFRHFLITNDKALFLLKIDLELFKKIRSKIH